MAGRTRRRLSAGWSAAGREAGFRGRRCRTRTMSAHRASTHRFVESIIHEARAAAPRPPEPLPVSHSPLHAAIVWADPARGTVFAAWLDEVAARHGIVVASLRPASSDASFRRYFRADLASGGSVIVMDAPPPHEDVRRFMHVAGLIERARLHAPRVLEADAGHGFLLLDDLGSELYLHALQAAQARGDAARADTLMREAIAALIVWQGQHRRCHAAFL